LLVVEDDAAFRDSLALLLERAGCEVCCAGSLAEARAAMKDRSFDAVMVDRTLPDGLGTTLLDDFRSRDFRSRDIRSRAPESIPDSIPEWIVVTGDSSVPTAVEAMRDGALDYLTKPLDAGQLESALANLRRVRALQREVEALREELRLRGRFGAIVGRSAAMQPIFDTIQRVAPTNASVLIHGESGTGKELIAQAIHELSSRRDRMLLPVNCGAITETLIESELFGHERGSFTGADRVHKGVFERADGGTLFLDEITEMPAHLQVKLLRALETGVISRVGGSTEMRTNVRVLAATNQDPQEALRQGRLREDLFFRLAVFAIHLPPLREREGDVALLATHLLDKLNETNGTDKRWAPGALPQLEQHPWKGNVRELKNAVQRAFILADSELRASDATPRAEHPGASDASIAVRVGSTVAEAERELILATLEHVKGNKPAAAKMLGISLKTLYIRLNLYKVAQA
jgi:DNA-binding NtrC family response regulator